MNVKFLGILSKRDNIDKAKHGLSEQLRLGSTELVGASLDAYPSNSSINIFDDFLAVISGSGLPSNVNYELPKLLQQVVAGHRLWSLATRQKERFISIERIQFIENSSKEIWLRIYLFADDLSRFNLTHKYLLDSTNLASDWREVNCHEKIDGRKLLCFEQMNAVQYRSRSSDSVQTLVTMLRPRLWATVQNSFPYRRYYLYMAPPNEMALVLPQLLSTYAIMFYLGSITRYRPHHFDKIIDGIYGAMIEEFLNDQPTQFIYLLASEFAHQEVTKASIV